MAIKTVGELRRALVQYPDDMPLWLTASCYEHDGRVFTQIRPDMCRIRSHKENPDGSEELTYPGVGICVYPEERDVRAVKKKKGDKWEYEYGKFLRIENANSEDFELDD